MARAIDGELLELEIANIANKLAKSDAQKALMGRVMYCVEHMPTLIPTNEPEYREYTCPYCYHTWLEDRDASDYPNYCPVCRAVLRDGSAPPNEPLTLEELREMDGEPVWVDDEKTWAILQVWDDQNIDAVFPIQRGCFRAESVLGMKIYRRPPEGEINY